jgi:hypothetical protein
MTTSKWAVILCKFADDTTATLPLQHYQRLFTGVGSGASNMTDFFSDMSHGHLDLTGSEVFGWFTLSINKAEYGTTYGRNELVGFCRQAATGGGVNLNNFNGVVVSMNGGVDLFGYVGGMEAFCDSNSLSPSPLGQEMGHGYGLDHARLDGSTADYQDPWDVMSVYASYMAANHEWGSIGPGLNAWCMRSQGWLDETRVWSSTSPGFNQIIQLRPLHRRDLSGLLAANLGQYLIEYRPAQHWDAAFPRSAVFVHRFEDNHSYVMPGTQGNADLVAGDVFEHGTQNSYFTDWNKVEVISIDDSTLTATIRVHHQDRVPFPLIELIGRLVGGVAVDGGGGIIIGGKYHPVPPRGPEIEILTQLASYISAQDITDIRIRNQAQLAAMSSIERIMATRAEQLEPLRTPAPPLRGAQEDAQPG